MERGAAARSTGEASAAELREMTELCGAPGTRRERVAQAMRVWQERIVHGLETLDGEGAFRRFSWDRPGGGGGRARVIEDGRVFERGGVNVSAVHGEHVPPSLAAQHPGTEGRPFFATGLSMVLHPRNPHVPAFHANYRYFEVGHGEESGVWWFGGGADLTPAYPREEDVIFFHRTLRGLCERHEQADFPAWKATCDDYFTVRHRGEMRGVGGIFFDELTPPAASRDAAADGAATDDARDGDAADEAAGALDRDRFEADLAFVEDGLATILPAYLPIAERHVDAAWSEAEKAWQLLRRGRYVEFNLVYDRGTLFGLQTRGNIEAILMSMPSEASWRFDHRPEPGSPEARALRFYQPRDWAGLAPGAARERIDAEVAGARGA
jgi:coproporphyrinogen III oxidase